MKWHCRHGKLLADCTICFYDLPPNMRPLNHDWSKWPLKRAQAERYLDERYASVRKFGGGKRIPL